MKEEKQIQVYLIRQQFDGQIEEKQENIIAESPVIPGQALTGAELFRRQSAGLPVGCAVRSFNQVNPYLEKFSVYDALTDFKVRHGMLDSEQIKEIEVETTPPEKEVPSTETE